MKMTILNQSSAERTAVSKDSPRWNGGAKVDGMERDEMRCECECNVYWQSFGDAAADADDDDVVDESLSQLSHRTRLG